MNKLKIISVILIIRATNKKRNRRIRTFVIQRYVSMRIDLIPPCLHLKRSTPKPFEKTGVTWPYSHWQNPSYSLYSSSIPRTLPTFPSCNTLPSPRGVDHVGLIGFWFCNGLERRELFMSTASAFVAREPGTWWPPAVNCPPTPPSQLSVGCGCCHTGRAPSRGQIAAASWMLHSSSTFIVKPLITEKKN